MSPKPFENPLTPNKRLRELYTALVHTRLLSSTLRHTGPKNFQGFPKGLEACWVAPAIGLRDSSSHLILPGPASPLLLDTILGASVKSTLRAATTRKSTTTSTLTPAETLLFHLGSLSTQPEPSDAEPTRKVALLFTAAQTLAHPDGRRILAEALRLQLPAVFVVIPEEKRAPGIAEAATRKGLPGIPVDAADPIALYRVAQESLGRARAGGGPALLEPILFPNPGDPIALLKKQLLKKQVITERWAEALTTKLHSKPTP